VCARKHIVSRLNQRVKLLGLTPSGIIVELISIIASTLLVATWLAYPLLVFALRNRHPFRTGEGRWRVTALVAAWNAEKEIGRRVRNLAEQTYPAELLQIYVASDGSTDDTLSEALKAAPGRVIAKQFPRGGKSAVQTAAMADITDEIVVLTDADTDFASDCVEQLLAPFSDPQVGCVTGTIISRDASRPLSKDQALYWRFENWLRLCESDAGILITAAGPCMAFRRKLFKPLLPTLGDDCMIPLDVALRGYRIVHAPLAIAYDTFPSTPRGELLARKRMTTRNLAGFFARPVLLNPLRYPGYALSLWLHKIFRWMTPFFALALALSSVRLWVLLPELAFLLLAIWGGLSAMRRGPAPRIASAAFSFVVVNLGFALGVLNWLGGRKITTYTNLRDTIPPRT
jgi:cellulose synthase/poly-beta-1,6-N-acetylglucosamine synthase-like glycosyltransferase